MTLTLIVSLGLLLGVLPLPRRPVLATLVVVSIAVAVTTLYWSMPQPQFRASIVDAEIISCGPPASLKDEAFERWDKTVARTTWAPAREGWREDFDRMVREDPGVVLEMSVSRTSRVYENRKPWNRGTLSASSWKQEGKKMHYYSRYLGGSCDGYPVGERALYLAQGETAGGWPPNVLSNFLDLQLLAPVPDDYRRLVSE